MDAYFTAKELVLAAGIELFIEIGGVECRLKSSLVGIKPRECFIIDTPRLRGIETKIFGGNKVSVVFLFGGTIYGFKSTILEGIRDPSRLTFISYPQTIECHELRENERVQCCMPAMIKLDSHNQSHDGIVIDISSSGCKFSTNKLPKDILHFIQYDTLITITFDLLTSKAHMICDGQIMNIKFSGTNVSLGIKFLNISDTIRSQLETYVKNVLGFRPHS
jgi:c-di-GMP-binding flagellar brake protein YcgR